MFYFSKCTARVLLALLTLPSKSVKNTCKEVLVKLQNCKIDIVSWYIFRNLTIYIYFFPRTNLSGCFYLYISSLIRLFSYREEYSNLFCLCNYFSIGFKNISPVTSAKFNETSELISSGKSKNFVSTFYRHCLSNTVCLWTTVIIPTCLKADLHSENW